MCRVKFGGFLKLGIRRRVSYPFRLLVMYTRRRRIPSVAKRTRDIQTMKHPRLPVLALTLISMEDLDQGCDRRVESDPLTLNPMATANQTSIWVGSVGNGRLRMRRPARLTLHRVYKLWLEQGILKLGRGGECRRRPTNAQTEQDDDHILNKPEKNKMSETVRAVGRERTTIIVTYISFRPSWSSNVELILRSNQVVGEMNDIIYKCYGYRAESSTLRFPDVWQCVIMSMAKPAGPDASKHGIYSDLSSHGII